MLSPCHVTIRDILGLCKLLRHRNRNTAFDILRLLISESFNKRRRKWSLQFDQTGSRTAADWVIVSKADSDITFRSCDGVLFGVHRKNLSCMSEGFSPPEGTISQSDIISLTEDGDTLEMLFQYMYPERNPDPKDIDFKHLSELAEAAEKYQVYTAMLICNVRMGEAYREHPFEVMMYAPELMDKSARIALQVSPTMAFGSFTPQVYIAWTRYYAQWLDLLASLHRSLDKIRSFGFYGTGGDHIHREVHIRWFQWAVSQLDRPASLLKLETLFDPKLPKEMEVCSDCKRHFESWRDDDMRKGIEGMQHLSSFL